MKMEIVLLYFVPSNFHMCVYPGCFYIRAFIVSDVWTIVNLRFINYKKTLPATS